MNAETKTRKKMYIIHTVFCNLVKMEEIHFSISKMAEVFPFYCIFFYFLLFGRFSETSFGKKFRERHSKHFPGNLQKKFFLVSEKDL